MSKRGRRDIPKLADFIRHAKERGDREMILYLSRVVAEDAPIIPLRSSINQNFYSKHNFCTNCRRVYPKEITYCVPCHRQVRTRPRRRRV